MTVVDRLVDAWVWFNEDVEDPYRETYDAAITIYELCYWAGVPIFFGGIAVLSREPSEWRTAFPIIGLGAAMIVVAVLPMALIMGLVMLLASFVS